MKKIKILIVALVAFSLILTLNVSAQTSAKNPDITNFYYYYLTNNKLKVAAIIKDTGDSNPDLKECSFLSERPSLNIPLQQFKPDSTHTDQHYCFGEIDLTTSLYEPEAKIRGINFSNKTTDLLVYGEYKTKPKITGINVNGKNVAGSTNLKTGFSGPVTIILNIDDVLGNKDCNLQSLQDNLGEYSIINSYQSCTIKISNLTQSVNLAFTSANLLDVSSEKITLDINIPTPAMETPQTPVVEQQQNSNIDLVKSYSPTKGKVVRADNSSYIEEEILNKVYSNSFCFWLLIALVIISLPVGIVLVKNKKVKTNLKFPSILVLLTLDILFITAFVLTSKTTSEIQTTKNYIVKTYEVPTKNGQNSDIIKTINNLNLDPVKFPEVKYRYPLAPILNQSQEKVNLEVESAQLMDGPLWSNEANVGISTGFVKDFHITLPKKENPDLYFQVSNNLIPESTCSQDLLYEQKLDKKPQIYDDREEYLDFKKFLPTLYINGSLNGDLSYYVRIVERTSDCEYKKISNNVKVNIYSQLLYDYVNSQAKSFTLFTTKDKNKTGGEFPNTEDKTQLDWNLEAVKQNMRFLFEGQNKYPNYGRWQVSILPFQENICLNNPGVIAYQDVDLTKSNVTDLAFNIDFSKIALNKKGNKPNVNAVINSNFLLNAPVSISKGMFAQFTDLNDPTNKEIDKYNLDGNDLVKYYVRFIGLNLEDGSCDSDFKPSTTVEINYGEPQKTEPLVLPSNVYHSIETSSKLEISSINYEPVRFQEDPFNPAGHYVYTQDIKGIDGKNIISKGEKLYIPANPPEKDESFWDKIGNAIDSIVSFVSKVVSAFNYVVEKYNSLKSLATNVLASGLNSIGIPCDSTCKAALNAGLSVGQAALGIPPSLPNFDQLMDKGIDYMAAELAEQVAESTGVPLADTAVEELSKKALKELKNNIKSTVDEGTTKEGLLLQPDPDYLYKPASISITVKNTTNEDQKGYLTVRFTDKSAIKNVDLDTRNLYVYKTLDIPTIRPGKTLTIPVSLEENYNDYKSYNNDVSPETLCSGNCADIISDPGYAAGQRKNRWLQAYNSGSITLDISVTGKYALSNNFDPKSQGFDSTGWEKQKNSYGEQVWFDKKNNTYHHFTAKPVGNFNINQQINPNQNFEY